MKILIISTNYSPELTGIGKYSGEMAEWLANKGHDVTVICAPPYYPEWKIQKPYNSWQYKYEKINGVNVVRCPIWVPASVTGLKRILHLFSFACSSFPIVLAQLLKKNDVIFTVEPSFLNSFSALLLSKLSNAKSILHIQDFEIDVAFELGIIKNDFLKKLLLFIERKTMSKFDIVSTSSEAMVELLLKKNLQKEKTYLFPNWVDTSSIYPLHNVRKYRDELDIPDNHKVALYSGNMGEKQGLEIIIEAAKFLQQKDITFIMCGAGVALKRLMNSSKDLKNILWIDLQPLENLNQLLNTADIHLLPQLPGAADLLMPSKLNGMLSSGKPIVATAEQNTQIEKVVKHCGIVVPPNKIEEFSNAIILLADDDNLSSALGVAARNYAETWLEYEAIMTRFEQLLNKMNDEI